MKILHKIVAILMTVARFLGFLAGKEKNEEKNPPKPEKPGENTGKGNL